jgi:hypothetical protein
VRLAIICRVLFSESGGKSLMQQLGAHKTITLPDTAVFDAQPIAPGISIQLIGTDAEGNEGVVNDESCGGLTELTNGPRGGMRWTAPLDTRMPQARWMKLSAWLSSVAVRSSTDVTHSRWDFIRVLANQEGGAHLDPTVEISYTQLRGDTLGVLSGPFTPAPGGGFPEKIDLEAMQPPETNVVEASMRQIAHEAIRALEKHFGSDLT